MVAWANEYSWYPLNGLEVVEEDRFAKHQPWLALTLFTPAHAASRDTLLNALGSLYHFRCFPS